MIRALGNKIYGERLKQLGLLSQERRKLEDQGRHFSVAIGTGLEVNALNLQAAEI